MSRSSDEVAKQTVGEGGKKDGEMSGKNSGGKRKGEVVK